MSTMKTLSVLPVTDLTFDNIEKVFKYLEVIGNIDPTIGNGKRKEQAIDLLYNLLPIKEFNELLIATNFTNYISHSFVDNEIRFPFLLNISMTLSSIKANFFTELEKEACAKGKYTFSRTNYVVNDTDVKIINGVLVVKVTAEFIKDILVSIAFNGCKQNDSNYVNKIIFRFYLNTITSRPNFVHDNNINRTINKLTDIYLKM